ncbi:hypothetical protein SNK04_013668 [Fusarium graminearum]
MFCAFLARRCWRQTVDDATGRRPQVDWDGFCNGLHGLSLLRRSDRQSTPIRVIDNRSHGNSTDDCTIHTVESSHREILSVPVLRRPVLTGKADAVRPLSLEALLGLSEVCPLALVAGVGPDAISARTASNLLAARRRLEHHTLWMWRKRVLQVAVHECSLSGRALVTHGAHSDSPSVREMCQQARDSEESTKQIPTLRVHEHRGDVRCAGLSGLVGQKSGQHADGALELGAGMECGDRLLYVTMGLGVC